MVKSPKEVGIAYAITNGSLNLVSRLSEFTEEDKSLFNTGADLVKTYRGFYKLVSVFAECEPSGFYRGYEHVDSKDVSIRKKR